MDLFLLSAKNDLSDITPVDNQAAINLSTGQAYWYLGGEYVPFTGGYSQDIDNYVVSVFIDGLFVNERVVADSLTITDSLNEKVNTCRFDYRNEANSSYNLAYGMSILVFDYNLEKIFAGQILDFDKEEESITSDYILYSVGCSGWEKKLQTKKVAENYQNKTCKEIIVDIFDKYLPEFGTSLFVEDGLFIENISFNYIGLDQCLKKLTAIADYEWYVDYEKNIHFFSKQTYDAPVVIEAGGKFSNFNIGIDGSQLKNSITLVGGFYYELYEYDIQVADGERTNFLTAYTPYSPISVYVDYGAGFVQKTVGIKNIDLSGFDFLVSFSEKNIENLDEPKLSAGDIIKITYNRQVPVLAYGEDTDSIAIVKALQGGDGKLEDVIVDSSIDNLETANNRISAELISYANTQISGSFRTNIPGFKSGQLLTINLVNFELDYYQVLIQSVKIKPKTNKQTDGSFLIEYDVKFATAIKGLQEFLLDLYNAGKEISLNENETVHTYFQYTKDKIKFVNDEISQTQHSTGVYNWDDADALWDFAQWG